MQNAAEAEKTAFTARVCVEPTVWAYSQCDYASPNFGAVYAIAV